MKPSYNHIFGYPLDHAMYRPDDKAARAFAPKSVDRRGPNSDWALAYELDPIQVRSALLDVPHQGGRFFAYTLSLYGVIWACRAPPTGERSWWLEYVIAIPGADTYRDPDMVRAVSSDIGPFDTKAAAYAFVLNTPESLAYKILANRLSHTA